MGKALLAQLDQAALAVALERPRDVRTMHTLTSADALLGELEKVRVAGVAIDDEENELGVRCIGTVVHGNLTVFNNTGLNPTAQFALILGPLPDGVTLDPSVPTVLLSNGQVAVPLPFPGVPNGRAVRIPIKLLHGD